MSRSSKHPYTRIRAIVDSPEGKASSYLALHLAMNTEIAVDSALTILRLARLDRAKSVVSGFVSGTVLAWCFANQPRRREGTRARSRRPRAR